MEPFGDADEGKDELGEETAYSEDAVGEDSHASKENTTPEYFKLADIQKGLDTIHEKHKRCARFPIACF